jgi:hypothetical protein
MFRDNRQLAVVAGLALAGMLGLAGRASAAGCAHPGARVGAAHLDLLLEAGAMKLPEPPKEEGSPPPTCSGVLCSGNPGLPADVQSVTVVPLLPNWAIVGESISNAAPRAAWVFDEVSRFRSRGVAGGIFHPPRVRS